jgi:hypothetical protein
MTAFGVFHNKKDAIDRYRQVITNPYVKNEKVEHLKQKQKQVWDAMSNSTEPNISAPTEWDSKVESDNGVAARNAHISDDDGTCQHANIAADYPCCLDCGLLIEREIDTYVETQHSYNEVSTCTYPRTSSLTVSKIDELYFVRYGTYLRKFNRVLLNTIADIYIFHAHV